MSEDLRKIAADLREAKRYVRSNPEEVSRRLVVAVRDIYAHFSGTFGSHDVIDRLAGNLATGAAFVQVDPDVLAGYIEGAAFELEVMAGPIEVPEVVLDV